MKFLEKFNLTMLILGCTGINVSGDDIFLGCIFGAIALTSGITFIFIPKGE